MTGFQKKIISRAMDRLDELSEWEVEFIDSLAQKDDEHVLSEKQNHQLNNVLNKLDFG